MLCRIVPTNPAYVDALASVVKKFLELRGMEAEVRVEGDDVVVEKVVGPPELLAAVPGIEKVICCDKVLKGVGGLPPGVMGRAIALFSGGLDSPVAAWLVARRGVEVDLLHIVFASPRSAYQAFEVAKKLAETEVLGPDPKFVVVNLSKVMAEYISKARMSLVQVVIRSLMYVVASRIAEKMGYEAVVTGESVGQASSQTLANIRSIEAVVKPHVPVLRPLAGMDKEEIVSLSRRLGLYELSTRVEELCAIAQGPVATRATAEELRRELSKVSMEGVERAVDNARILRILSSTSADVLGDEVEIDFLPKNTLVVDMRSLKEYQEWHLPGAVHISRMPPLDELKGKVVVLYCDRGEVSYLFALKLRGMGVKAFSLKGGVEGAKSCLRNARL